MNDQQAALASEDVLTTEQVAKFLHVSVRTVARLHLPSVKVGRLRRYLREQVLDHLRQRSA